MGDIVAPDLDFDNPYSAPKARLTEPRRPGNFGNPWATIWTSPRATIRRVVEVDPTRHLITLVGLVAVAGSVSNLAAATITDPGWLAFLVVGFAVVLFGVNFILLFVFAAIQRWVGGLLGGVATQEQLRAAHAWSFVPILVTIPVSLALMGMSFAAANGLMPVIGALPPLAAAVQLVLAIWSYVIYLNCVGEVHRFSTRRAFGAQVLLTLVLLGVVIGVALGFFLIVLIATNLR